MSNIVKEIGVGDFVTEAYYEYGLHKNTGRDFNSVWDGLKPVYRRLIYTLYEAGKGLHKTANIVGMCMGHYHPHSSKAMEDVLVNLVTSGIVRGQGNWGSLHLDGDNTLPAASRYTECELHPTWRAFFDLLLPHVPYVHGEVKGMIPMYLPTPIPLSLLTSSIGIGIGANQFVPAFEFKSIYEAYINDDPKLLKGPKGLELVLEESDLDSIWNNGNGRLTYRNPIEYGWHGDCYGVMITGSTLLGTLNLSELSEWKSEGWVFFRNETDSGGKRLLIARNKGVRKITDEDIIEACTKAATRSIWYNLNVSEGVNIYRIPLKKWIKRSVTNYLTLYNTYIESEITKIEYELEVQKWLPSVVKILIREYQKDSEEYVDVDEIIKEELGISQEIITSITRKSIGTLKRVDTESVIKNLELSLDKFKGMDAYQEIESIIYNTEL